VFRFGVDIARSGMLASSTRCTATITTANVSRQKPQPVPRASTMTCGSGLRRSSRIRLRDATATSAGLRLLGGQLTDLGAHFADLAQWAHGIEDTSPTQYEGWAEFPKMGCGTRLCDSRSPPRTPTA